MFKAIDHINQQANRDRHKQGEIGYYSNNQIPLKTIGCTYSNVMSWYPGKSIDV